MAKYNVKVGEWVTPTEDTGSIQNLGNVPIEISATNDENTGIKLESGQMVNFDGTVYVRSAGNKPATFTTVPFKVIAGGGGGGGGGTYTLPTASTTVKGGIKVGTGLTITSEILSADKQIVNWITNKQYKVGDIVVQNNQLYKCKTNHTSSTFDSDINNWDLLSSSTESWSSSTFYPVGSTVIYNNILYQCNTEHTSTSIFDGTKWNKIGETFVTTLPNWATGKSYTSNQLVYYGHSVYRCTTPHTSSAFETDIAKWEQVYADIKTWQASIYYPVGTIVINDNKLYFCKTAHTSGNSFDSTNWNMLSGGGSGVTVLNNWAANTEYVVNEIIYKDNAIYRCKTAHTSTSTFDDSKFDLIIESSVIKEWKATTAYSVNDLVVYSGNIYKCKTAHTSGSSFDSTEQENWTTLWVIATKTQVDNLFI